VHHLFNDLVDLFSACTEQVRKRRSCFRSLRSCIIEIVACIVQDVLYCQTIVKCDG